MWLGLADGSATWQGSCEGRCKRLARPSSRVRDVCTTGCYLTQPLLLAAAAWCDLLC
jgi:hypothetical protein